MDGQSRDRIVRNPAGSGILIELFDDFNIRDQLVIEDPSGGNGVGTDPNNSNTTNDLYRSNTGPDGNLPDVINRPVTPSPTGRTCFRVIANVNGTIGVPSAYRVSIMYMSIRRRVVERWLFLGFIPLWRKGPKTRWQNTTTLPTTIRRIQREITDEGTVNR